MHRNTKMLSAGNTGTTKTSQEMDRPTATETYFESSPPNRKEELDAQTAANGEFEGSTTHYPGTIALAFLMTAICASIFLVSLDRTIITKVSQRQTTISNGVADPALSTTIGDSTHY